MARSAQNLKFLPSKTGLGYWKGKAVWGRYGCGIWKSIQMIEDVWKFIRFKLGSGKEIRFWEDRWVRDGLLKESFRILYGLSIDPLDKVVDWFDFLGNIWVPRLRKNLNDWEMGELLGLFNLLENNKPDPSMDDGWEWVICSKGRFTSKSLYSE